MTNVYKLNIEETKEVMELKESLRRLMMNSVKFARPTLDEVEKENGKLSIEYASLYVTSMYAGLCAPVFSDNTEEAEDKKRFVAETATKIALYLLEHNPEYLEGYAFIRPYAPKGIPTLLDLVERDIDDVLYDIAIAINIPASYQIATCKEF